MDAKIQKLLAEWREPALWFHTSDKVHSKSRRGGLPSLPEGVDWPVNPDSKLALHFMAQVDLAALPGTPLPGSSFDVALPREGMLFFFFDFAEYWDGDFEETDSRGIPKQTRVIHTLAAGADRAAPRNLPKIGYTPGAKAGGSTKGKLLSEQHLRAYAIDTFWRTGTDKKGNDIYLFKNRENEPAKFQSIVNATGEAAPIYPDHEAIPTPRPSYYTFIDNGPRNECLGMQMFGADWFNGRKPRDKNKLLLLEFPLFEAHEIGSLQFWMDAKDLKAQRFEEVFGEAEFS